MGAQRDRVQAALDLTDAETAALLDDRDAADVTDIVFTVTLLERTLRPGLLPGLCRQPVDGLAGATLLDSLTTHPHGTRLLYEQVFSYWVGE